ncbi:hypothetical protein PENANT_c388G06327, partial [Penicillium antarcticum]
VLFVIASLASFVPYLVFAVFGALRIQLFTTGLQRAIRIVEGRDLIEELGKS